jgi:hypothetical protein
MQIVLVTAGVLSLFPIRQLGTGVLLILLTLGNAVLGLQQEGKAEAAVAALQKMTIVTARVRRDGQEAEIHAEQLVPGDVVSIAAGDIVPADGRLLRAAPLDVAESKLTGESLPASKGTAPAGEAGLPLGDRACMVYMNTAWPCRRHAAPHARQEPDGPRSSRSLLRDVVVNVSEAGRDDDAECVPGDGEGAGLGAGDLPVQDHLQRPIHDEQGAPGHRVPVHRRRTPGRHRPSRCTTRSRRIAA